MRPVLLITPLIIVLAGCRQDAQSLLTDGDRLYRQGKYYEASLRYRKALQRDAQRGETSYRLGLSELKLRRPEQALQAFRRAIALMPAHEASRVELADLYLREYLDDPERPPEIRKEVERHIGLLLAANPRCWQAMRINGELALASGDVAVAERQFTAAADIQRLEPSVSVPLARIWMAGTRKAEGEQLLLSVIEHRGDPAAYDALYLQYLATQRLPEAERLLQRKIGAHSAEPIFRVQLCSFYSGVQRKDDLERCAAEVLRQAGDRQDVYRELANVYRNRGEVDRAIELFRQGAAVLPSSDDARTLKLDAAAVLGRAGRIDQAVAQLNELLRQKPDDDGALALRAAIRIDSGRLEQLEPAVQELREGLRVADEPTLHFLLGRALTRRGDLLGAQRAFSEAVRAHRDYVLAELALTEVLIAIGDYREAERHASKVIANHPSNVPARLLRASALTGAGAFAEARTDLNSLLERNFGGSAVRLQLALLEMAEGKLENAERTLAKLHQEAPEVNVAKAYGEALARQRKFGIALAIVNAALTRQPDSYPMLAMRAELTARSGSLPEALARYQEMRDRFDLAADLHVRVAEVLFAQRKVPEARSELERARELEPENLRHVIALGALMESSGQRREAVAYYREALLREPRNVVLLNSLAYNLAELRMDLEEALQHATTAVRVREEPAFLDTLAWVHVRRKNYDEALRLLRPLVAQYPKNGEYRYHLAVALLNKGDAAIAREELKVALASPMPADILAQARSLISTL